MVYQRRWVKRRDLACRSQSSKSVQCIRVHIKSCHHHRFGNTLQDIMIHETWKCCQHHNDTVQLGYFWISVTFLCLNSLLRKLFVGHPAPRQPCKLYFHDLQQQTLVQGFPTWGSGPSGGCEPLKRGKANVRIQIYFFSRWEGKIIINTTKAKQN